MSNPILAEVMRGSLRESRHAGAYAVMDRQGHLVASAGDIDSPVFPRSAVKAFQCLAMIESGAADRFGFTPAEIALCCASHSGEPGHVATARAMLVKAANTEADYECGAHWPGDEPSMHALVRAGLLPQPVHNNCSGKHAGMLALARMLGADPRGYVSPHHPVQRAVADAMGAICGCALRPEAAAIDGCSVPTWAMPLRHLAQGFARFTDPGRAAAQRIIAAVRAHPFLVAGSGCFCTELMSAVPRAFVKTGAEGIYCACIPHAGLGLALKCDDGARRATEPAIAALLAALDVWTPEERANLLALTVAPLVNWTGKTVGEVRAVAQLAALSAHQAASR